MKSLGNGKLHSGAKFLSPKPKTVVAPKCGDCRNCDTQRNYCNKFQFTVSDVEDISDMTINCFEEKETSEA